MQSLYLWVNLGAILFPLLLSFNKLGHFYKRFLPVFGAIGIMALCIIPWDIHFTNLGVWGFTSDYLVGFSFLSLPIEEWLFFICIPYAFMFLYDQLDILNVRSPFVKIERGISWFFLIASIVYLVAGFGNIYTTTVSVMGALLASIILYLNPRNQGLFYLSYLIILVPFTVVNGILTGYITETPIVWYNNAENLGLRFFTIPVEDFLYYYLMYGICYLTYEKIKKVTNLATS